MIRSRTSGREMMQSEERREREMIDVKQKGLGCDILYQWKKVALGAFSFRSYRVDGIEILCTNICGAAITRL